MFDVGRSFFRRSFDVISAFNFQLSAFEKGKAIVEC